MATDTSSRFSPIRYPGFLLYAGGRLCMVGAAQMITIAIGWQIYEITGSKLNLGLVGLAQFVPAFIFAFVSGPTADKLDRRRIVMACTAASLAATTLLLLRPGSLAVIFAVSAAFGIIRAFRAPAGSALVPALVPPRHLPGAIAWQMVIFQAATIGGPALGGIVYASYGGASRVYALAAGLYVLAFIAYLLIRPRPVEPRVPEPFLASLAAGLRYVRSNRILLGAISLDLFAVLLGGATALLPVFAKDVLGRGPETLGLLRSAPAVGAGLSAIFFAVRPIRRRVGARLLWAVALFGAGTILFGLSRSLPAAVGALILVGAADMVSVVVRHTLIQACTPDEMRGRVSAVAFIFIGGSNELGEFESGVTAEWFGTVPAIVLGGAASLGIVALWAGFFPALRRADRYEPHGGEKTNPDVPDDGLPDG